MRDRNVSPAIGAHRWTRRARFLNRPRLTAISQHLRRFVYRARGQVLAGFPFQFPQRAIDPDLALLRQRGRRVSLTALPAWAKPIAFLCMFFGWPVRAVHHSWQVAARDAGKPDMPSRGQSFRRLLRLALLYSVPPDEAQVYGFHHSPPVRLEGWTFNTDFPWLCSALTPRSVRELAGDKLAFDRFAKNAGLPVPEILAVVPGEIRDAPPESDLVLKPRRGAGGVQISRWVFADGRYRYGAGDLPLKAQNRGPLAWPDLLAEIRSWQPGPEMLVQTAIRDPFGRAPEALAPSLRLITLAGRASEPRVALAAIQWPLAGGAISQSGTWREISVATGTIHNRWVRGLGPLPDGWNEARLRSGLANHWEQAATLAIAAHSALPERTPIIAWDMVAGPDGMKVLEANISQTLFFFQLARGGTAVQDLLPELVEWLR